MPKEIKSTSRRSRRQCMKVDNKVATPDQGGPTKSATGNKRYSPFQRKSSKKEHSEPKLEKQNVTMTSTELLHSISGGIIGSGIKYIMLPLHLLRFCLFGANAVFEKVAVREDHKVREDHEVREDHKVREDRKVREDHKVREVHKVRGDRKVREDRKVDEDDKVSKDHKVREDVKESKNSRSSNKERKKEETEDKSFRSKDDRRAKDDEALNRRSSEESRKSTRSDAPTEKRNAVSSQGKDSKEVQKGDDKGLLVKPLVAAAEEDSDSSGDRWSTASSTMIENISMDIDKSMYFDHLEEPMDISMEEYTYERSQIRMKSYDQKGDITSSVDEEIARIFQKQCTSSDDEYSSSHSWPVSEKREKTRGHNFLCHGRTSHFAATVPPKSKKEEVDKERKKQTPSEDIGHHKRRKVSDEENKHEKQRDNKSDAKCREEKHSCKKDTPSKSKTRSPRTPVKSKESKRKDVKYKEIATQTDSALSDEDVEMISVDAKLSERRFCCKCVAYKLHPHFYQYRGTEHESNYAADNEDSNDGFARIARKRISSCSTSSSSTDLGFDEHGTPPDSDIGKGRWHANAREKITGYRMYSRAPPGFPRLPLNPPLLSYTHTDWYNVRTTSLNNNYCDTSLMPTGVPRAPSPMRHLYYEYPEFMDLPATLNSSNILDVSRNNNYYR